MIAIEKIVCPHCRSSVSADEGGVACDSCSRTFPKNDQGQIDLRLQSRERRMVEVNVGRYESHRDIELSRISEGRYPDREAELPTRLSSVLYGHLPPAENEDGLLLDVGCGSGNLKYCVSEKGYEWVGVDIGGSGAQILADVHSLPFAASTFDAVLSLKVLEHVQYPYLSLFEIRRVLKPGKKFLGNVAFIESFHGDSKFHHSPIGIAATIKESDLILEEIGPSKHGLFSMGTRMFPLIPNSLSSSILLPTYLIHRLVYLIGGALTDHEKATDTYRRIKFAGEFEFVSKAPETE